MSPLAIRFKDYPNGCMLAELYNPTNDKAVQIGFYHATEKRMTLRRCLCKGKANTHCPSLGFFIWRVLWIFEDIVSDCHIKLRFNGISNTVDADIYDVEDILNYLSNLFRH